MPVTVQRNHTPFYSGKYNEKMYSIVTSTEPQNDCGFGSLEAMKTKALFDCIIHLEMSYHINEHLYFPHILDLIEFRRSLAGISSFMNLKRSPLYKSLFQELTDPYIVLNRGAKSTWLELSHTLPTSQPM